MDKSLPPINLVVIDGDLCYPAHSHRGQDTNEPLLLLRIYPEGDCDAVSWPLRGSDFKNLPLVLFDDRECGNILDQEVLLPDGTSAWDVTEPRPITDEEIRNWP